MTATPPRVDAPFGERLSDRWPGPRQGRSDAPTTRGTTDGYQPDLTGEWQGSGGETVQIRGNHARIWGGGHQACDCVFFLVGQRLIAYSPETDRLRKYWFEGQRDRFRLIDEDGNRLSFWRIR